MKRLWLVLLLLVSSCANHEDVFLPWMLDWPEAEGSFYTNEGGKLLIFIGVSGPYSSCPHTYWWSWDRDPNPVRTRFDLVSPGIDEDGTFPADVMLRFMLSGFTRGSHELRLLLHNHFTGEDVLRTFNIQVDPPMAPTPNDTPIIIGSVSTPNWTGD